MGQQFDVVLLSAQGRSLSLALDLQAKGMKVAYLDLTSLFQAWDLADWEGPFGLFDVRDEFTESQKAVNEWQVAIEPLPRGFCVYDQQGVVEFASPLSEFLIEKATKQNAQWLDSLLASLPSAEWREYNDDIDGLPRLRAQYPWYQRIPTAQRIADSLQRAEQRGVKVFAEPVLDVGLHKGRVESLQLNSSGIITADEFIWCLAQEDIMCLPPAVSSRVYPKGVIKAEGCWQRYQFLWTLGTSVMRPPGVLVVIGHRELPWSHGNLLVVEDMPSIGAVQVWIRVPAHARYLRSRMDEFAQQIQNILSKRWPITGLSLKQMPLEYEKSMGDLGASRQPLFNERELKRRPKPSAKNWIELGPEVVGSLDLNQRWLVENNVASGVSERFQKRIHGQKNAEANA